MITWVQHGQISPGPQVGLDVGGGAAVYATGVAEVGGVFHEPVGNSKISLLLSLCLLYGRFGKKKPVNNYELLFTSSIIDKWFNYY